MNVEPKGFLRAAGLSTILAAASLAAALLLRIASGATSDATPELLREIHAQSVLFISSEGAFILGGIFMIPLLPALYLSLREVRPTHALLSLTFGVVGVTSVLMDNVLEYSSVSLSYGFTSADAAERFAAVVTADAMLGSSGVAEMLFFILFGTGVLVISLAMLKSSFSRVLSGLGVVVGVFSVAAGILAPMVAFGVVISTVLYIIWLAPVGYTLARK